jgi:Zn-dependent protease with chaperone function
MAGLLPLLIALTIIETSAHPGRVPLVSALSLPLLFAVVGMSLVFWWLVGETTGRILAGRVRVSSGLEARRQLERWDLLAQAMTLGAFAGLCYGLHWADLARSYSLAIAPWALAQIIHWWTLARPLSATTGIRWRRGALVWHHVRFALLPLGIALPVLDACAWLANSTHLDQWLFGHFGHLVDVFGAMLLAIGVVAFLPWLLVRAWGARPVTDPALRSELEGACQRAGVRVGAILRWPVGGGRVYNAMVIGVLPRLRYVLFTDDMLRDFSAEQRVAVLGHELGHARYGHLWVYLLFALATGLLSFAARGPLDAWLITLPGLSRIDEDIRAGIGALLLLAVQWRFLFGFLSRACEREADAAGAELAGSGDLRQGAGIMREALGAVAHLAGIDPRAPSWRHYSLHERMLWLERVAAQPQVAALHHRHVRLIVDALAAMTGVLLAFAVILIG